MKRGVCAAGHKALWAEEFGGLPPNDFFASLDPLLNGFYFEDFLQKHIHLIRLPEISAVNGRNV